MGIVDEACGTLSAVVQLEVEEVGWWAEDADVGCIEGVVGLALA